MVGCAVLRAVVLRLSCHSRTSPIREMSLGFARLIGYLGLHGGGLVAPASCGKRGISKAAPGLFQGRKTMTEEQYRWAMVILFGAFVGAFIVLGIRFAKTRASSKCSQEKDANRIQVCLASLGALFGAVALPCIYYLAYIFPKTLAIWADTGDELSSAQAAVANLSQLCQPVGFLIMLSLFGFVIGCVFWAVHAHKGQRYEGQYDEQ